MITMVARMRVSPENAPAYEKLMDDVTRQTLENEPGVIHYSWARSASDPGMYVVIEVYQDEKVHAAHMTADYVRNSIPHSVALVDGKFDIQQYVSPGQEPVQLRHG